MKTKFAFLVFVSVAVSAGFALAQTQSAADHGKDEAAIRRLNEAVLKAHNAGDRATEESIEDADFTLAGDFGQLTKAQETEKQRKRTDFAPNIQLTVENAQFRFYGDAAVLTEVEKWGDPTQTAGYQTTSVWVKRGTGWKLVHLHYSALGKGAQ